MSEFEVRIDVSGSSGTYYTETRVPDQPDSTTLKALLEEATRAFAELFDDAYVNETNVGVSYADSKQEREYIVIDNTQPIEAQE